MFIYNRYIYNYYKLFVNILHMANFLVIKTPISSKPTTPNGVIDGAVFGVVPGRGYILN